MISIKDLLNKIKWDRNEQPEDYSIYYLDRISEKLIKVDFNQIKRVEGNFMILEKEGEEVNVPLHRIREVMKKGRVVWKR